MENSNNAFLAPHQDQLSFNQNYMQQPMQNPKDITDLTTAMNMALALMAKAFKLNYSTPTNNNQRISSNPRNRQIAQPGMNMGQDRQMQLVGGNSENQFRQYAGQNVGNLNGYNVIQNVGNQNLNGNGSLVAARAEGNATGHNADLDKIEEVNANCILMANLQQALTSGTQTDKAPVYDSDGSAEANVSKSISIQNEEFSDDTTPSVARKFLNEVKSTIVTLQRVVKHRMTLETHNWSSSAHQEFHKIVKNENFPIVNQVDARVQNFEIQFMKEAAKFVGDFKSLAKENDESLAKHKALELEIKRLLRAVVSQDIMSVVEKASVVDTSNLQTELEPYKDMQQKIERLQAQLGDLKGKSKDTSCVSDTINPLSQKLKNEHVELEFQASDQKDNKRGTSANTKFAKQSIVKNLLKVGETHPLSKPVTSNSVPTPQESKVMKNNKVIAPGMFRINPFKTFREEKNVPNNVRASARTKPLAVSQPSVITKKDVNYDSNENDKCFNQRKTKETSAKGYETKKVGFIERLATPKPRKSKFFLRWSPTGRLFDIKGKIIESSESESQSDCSNGDNACTSNTLEPKIKRFPNSTSLLGRLSRFVYGTVRFRNDHVAAILGFGDLQWGNILITRVYFVEGLGHNLFSVGQFYDTDLEVVFRRNACFVRNLEGVDLLKGDRSTNLYTINLHEMASVSPICLMARASSTKSKDEAPKVIKTFLKRITILLHVGISHQMSSVRTPQQNRVVEHRNQTLVEAARTMLINGRKPYISFLYVFGALCYPKNDREDIGKLGAKGDIGFFIGYSADSCAYRIFNRRTKKIIETTNVSFDELSAMDFEQRSSKPGLQSKLDLLFEAMYDYYISGQPSATARSVPDAQA
nr:integrase, catalytic region, zinc finger, CCHC-type, peptidase aspartic, catalytic [Tanacetum cinerariifolium]